MRYKLPEALGGGEYEALTDYRSKAGDDWRFRFRIPDVGLVDVPAESLTEVKPPLPPEPPTGSVVRDKHGRVWVSLHGSAWAWQSVVGGKERWEDLVAGRGPLIPLVPRCCVGVANKQVPLIAHESWCTWSAP